MRFHHYSLRRGVLTRLTFLILAAMILINIFTIKLSERDLIRSKQEVGHVLLQAFNHIIEARAKTKKISLKKSVTQPEFKKTAAKLLSSSGFTEAAITDKEGFLIFETGLRQEDRGMPIALARKASETEVTTRSFHGFTWAVIWFNRAVMRISTPVYIDRHNLGGITVGASLDPIYGNIRASERIFLLFPYTSHDDIFKTFLTFLSMALSRMVPSPTISCRTFCGFSCVY